jgi:hypothetical protein
MPNIFDTGEQRGFASLLKGPSARKGRRHVTSGIRELYPGSDNAVYLYDISLSAEKSFESLVKVYNIEILHEIAY